MSKRESGCEVARSSRRDTMLNNLRQKVWHFHKVGSYRRPISEEGGGEAGEDQLLTAETKQVAVQKLPGKRCCESQAQICRPGVGDKVTKLKKFSQTSNTVLPQLSPGPVTLVATVMPSTLSLSEPKAKDELETRDFGESENRRRTRRMRSDGATETEVEIAGLLEGSEAGQSLGRKVLLKPKARKKSRAGAKFRRLSHFLTILFRLWRLHAERVKHFLETNIDLLEVEEPKDLLFDVTEFRSDNQARVSHDTVRILKKQPTERTEEELKYIQIALGNYPAIAEYPIRMQKMMARRSWYEQYGTKRVIIRQGHPARCFYWILSGSVVVSRLDETSGLSKTVCFLHRDESFGELGIVNHAARRASVISKGPVELLVFDDEDYVEIFMSGGLGNPRDEFLRGLFYLADWPVELLANNSDNALLSYFKRGAVLMQHSRYSEWLFVIKSGSCLVLKKLLTPQPGNFAHKRHPERGQHDRKHQPDVSHHDTVKVRLQEKEATVESKLNPRVREQLLRELDLGVDLWPVLNREKANEDKEGRRAPDVEYGASGNSSSGGGGGSDDREGTLPKPGSSAKPSVKQRLGLASAGPFLTRTEMPNHPSAKDQEPASAEATAAENKMNALDVRLERIRQNRKLRMEKTTLVDDLNAPYIKAKSVNEIPETEADSNPTFVRVRTLVKGDIFGLSDLIHKDQPVFSLVSNGAECILIRKQFYLEHVSQKLMITLRKEVSPYPSDTELQEALQTYVDWEWARSRALHNALLWNRISRTDVQDARTRLLHAPAHVF